MSSHLVIVVETPEEEELRLKVRELAQVENDLAERELALETLRAALHSFDKRYTKALGPRWLILHGIDATIADLIATRSPADPAAKARADDARRQENDTADVIKDAPGIREQEAPTAELKQIYREAAKKVHPDLADDDSERETRTRIMAEVNVAYESGDVQRIREILQQWQQAPESVRGSDVGSDLVRLIRRIARVRSRLTLIESEVRALKDTDMFRLMESVAEAGERGVDLLAAMRRRVDAAIEVRTEDLRQLRVEAA